MINKIQLIWLFFACSPLFSLEIKPDSSPECAEPTEKNVQKHTMAIRLNPAFFTKAISHEKALEKTTTGVTPKAERILIIRTPINKEVINASMIPLIPRRLNRSLLADFNSVSSPLLHDFEHFEFQKSRYDTGKWAHSEAWHPRRSIGIDADHEKWPAMIELLAEEINFNSQEYFIATTIIALKKHFKQLAFALYYNTEYPTECRHYAAASSVVFAKLLNHEESSYSGSIHHIVGDLFDKNWQQGESHAWNILRLAEQNDENQEPDNIHNEVDAPSKESTGGSFSYWLIDVHSGFFIKLEPNLKTKELSINLVTENHYKKYQTEPLTDSFTKNMVKTSRELFSLGVSNTYTELYKDPAKRKLLAEKISSQYGYPGKTFYQIDMDVPEKSAE